MSVTKVNSGVCLFVWPVCLYICLLFFELSAADRRWLCVRPMNCRGFTLTWLEQVPRTIDDHSLEKQQQSWRRCPRVSGWVAIQSYLGAADIFSGERSRDGGFDGVMKLGTTSRHQTRASCFVHMVSVEIGVVARVPRHWCGHLVPTTSLQSAVSGLLHSWKIVSLFCFCH